MKRIFSKFSSSSHSIRRLSLNSSTSMPTIKLLRGGYNIDLQSVDSSFTKLHKAVYLNNVDRVKKCLAQKVDVNLRDNFGRTALHLAAVNGNLQIIGMLLAANSNVNVQDSEGKSPLMKAIECGHSDVLPVLMEAGANIDLADREHGNTALHHSLISADLNCSLYIIRNALIMDYNKRNQKQETFLHLCAKIPDLVSVIEELIANGIEIQAVDEMGRTAAQVAKNHSNTEAFRIITKYATAQLQPVLMDDDASNELDFDDTADSSHTDNRKRNSLASEHSFHSGGRVSVPIVSRSNSKLSSDSFASSSASNYHYRLSGLFEETIVEENQNSLSTVSDSMASHSGQQKNVNTGNSIDHNKDEENIYENCDQIRPQQSNKNDDLSDEMSELDQMLNADIDPGFQLQVKPNTELAYLGDSNFDGYNDESLTDNSEISGDNNIKDTSFITGSPIHNKLQLLEANVVELGQFQESVAVIDSFLPDEPVIYSSLIEVQPQLIKQMSLANPTPIQSPQSNHSSSTIESNSPKAEDDPDDKEQTKKSSSGLVRQKSYAQVLASPRKIANTNVNQNSQMSQVKSSPQRIPKLIANNPSNGSAQRKNLNRSNNNSNSFRSKTNYSSFSQPTSPARNILTQSVNSNRPRSNNNNSQFVGKVTKVSQTAEKRSKNPFDQNNNSHNYNANNTNLNCTPLINSPQNSPRFIAKRPESVYEDISFVKKAISANNGTESNSPNRNIRPKSQLIPQQHANIIHSSNHHSRSQAPFNLPTAASKFCQTDILYSDVKYSNFMESLGHLLFSGTVAYSNNGYTNGENTELEYLKRLTVMIRESNQTKIELEQKQKQVSLLEQITEQMRKQIESEQMQRQELENRISQLTNNQAMTGIRFDNFTTESSIAKAKQEMGMAVMVDFMKEHFALKIKHYETMMNEQLMENFALKKECHILKEQLRNLQASPLVACPDEMNTESNESRLHNSTQELSLLMNRFDDRLNSFSQMSPREQHNENEIRFRELMIQQFYGEISGLKNLMAKIVDGIDQSTNGVLDYKYGRHNSVPNRITSDTSLPNGVAHNDQSSNSSTTSTPSPQPPCDESDHPITSTPIVKSDKPKKICTLSRKKSFSMYDLTDCDIQYDMQNPRLNNNNFLALFDDKECNIGMNNQNERRKHLIQGKLNSNNIHQDNFGTFSYKSKYFQRKINELRQKLAINS